MTIIDRLESEVRSYSRSFPTVFARAAGAEMFSTDGRAYLDFFAGAGALNYGHNHPLLRDRLVEYITGGGIAHSLDMATEAKCGFLEALDRRVLRPRNLDFKVMFPGPTGTNAVEAALKLARKITKRTQILAFTNAFHGMTLGSLSVTGNAGKRGGAGVPLSHVLRAPFDGYFGPDVDTLQHLDLLISDRSSGIEAPAAFLLETVQAEGGINVATKAWMQELAKLARSHDALLIVDDIQVGCGRTGKILQLRGGSSISPDIVCLSKSLSGFGLPFALTMFRSELDVWEPGEHNGTFRGNNLAFVTATAALDEFWADARLSDEVARKSALAQARLAKIAATCGATVRGRGLILGLAFEHAEIARRASRFAFADGLLIETAGAEDQVLKLLPPLTLTVAQLERGLDLIERAVARAVAETRPVRKPADSARPRPRLAVIS